METISTIAPFIVRATDKTPAVSFVHEHQYFNISGVALSQKGRSTLMLASQWIKEYDAYLQSLIYSGNGFPKKIIFEFRLQQLDEPPKDGIKLLLYTIQLLQKRYVQVKIKWHYHSSDEHLKVFLHNSLESCSLFFELIDEMGVPSFFIYPTETSPKVFFDSSNNLFSISGSSRPEYTAMFYSHIIRWVEKNGKALMYGHAFNIHMEYFNSSSAKEIMKILLRLDSLYTSEKKGTVNWYLDADDLEEIEEEFAKNATNLSFNFIQMKNINHENV